MAERRNWTRQELLLAFNLYCKLPFGQFDHRNPHIIRLAQIINRTPSAVSMKLSNFASFDPLHQARGVKGLSNASVADRAAWAEFTSDWTRFAEESEQLLESLSQQEEAIISQPDFLEIPNRPTEGERLVKIRRGQRFFRKTILSAYGLCCICKIPIPELLVASHIIPWREREDLRLNPHNGLCLCALHDKAFDQGLITVTIDYKVRISPIIDNYLPHKTLLNSFKIYDDQVISLPHKFLPREDFLAIHLQRYFRSH